jgi:hypothetical protein
VTFKLRMKIVFPWEGMVAKKGPDLLKSSDKKLGLVRPGSRDFSKGNISWLRVERKEITFSGAGLGMNRIDSSETKRSSGQPQVQLRCSLATVTVSFMRVEVLRLMPK